MQNKAANKPFDYMASGLPQISSLKGELEDLILKNQIGLTIMLAMFFSLKTALKCI